MRTPHYPSDVTDDQWALVEPLIPVYPGGRPRKTATRDVLDAVFYRFGTWGIPLSTSLVNIAGTWALLVFFRRRMGSFGFGETSRSFLRVTAAAVVLAGVSWGVWYLLDQALGRSLPAQIVSLGMGLVVGYAAFFGMCRLLGLQELQTMLRLRRSRS